MTDGLVLCGVDASDAGTTVVAAAKATAERIGAPLLLTHVVTSLWGVTVPAFHADAESARQVEHGTPARRLLALANHHGAGLIVLGTRARRRWSVARYVARHAPCPVMIVGPAADPRAEAVTRPSYDRALLRRSPVPVVIVPER